MESKDELELEAAKREQQKETEELLVSVFSGEAETAWERLPPQWQENSGVTLAALQNGFLLDWGELCPELKRDRDIVIWAIQNECICWNEVPEQLRADHEVSFQAYMLGMITSTDVPFLNRDFFLGKLRKGELLWRDLPESLRTDPEFGSSAITSSDSDTCNALVVDIFKAVPTLREDYEVWEKLVECDFRHGSLLVFLLHFQRPRPPRRITSDRDLMMRACLNDYRVLKVIDESLRSDREFIDLVLNNDARALPYVSLDLMRRSPEYIVKWFKPFAEKLLDDVHGLDSRRIIHELALALSEAEFWSQHDAGVAWFGAGLPLCSEVPRVLTEDRETMLLIASNCMPKYRRDSFRFMPLLLRADKSFMTKVLEHDPTLFEFASHQLQQDNELALLTFSTIPRDYANLYVRKCRYNGQSAFLERLRVTIERKLELYETFVRTFLFGSLNDDSPLACLNQGIETSIHYKRLVAQYLDVPTGRELKILRRASANLSIV